MRLTAWFAVVRAYGIDGFSYASHTTIAQESEALGIQMTYYKAHFEKHVGIYILGYKKSEFNKDVKRVAEDTIKKWKKGEKIMEMKKVWQDDESLDALDAISEKTQTPINDVKDREREPITLADFKEAQKSDPILSLGPAKDIPISQGDEKVVDDIIELLQTTYKNQRTIIQEYSCEYQSEIDATQVMIEKLQSRIDNFEQSIAKIKLFIKKMSDALTFLDEQLIFQVSKSDELGEALQALKLAKEAFEKIN